MASRAPRRVRSVPLKVLATEPLEPHDTLICDFYTRQRIMGAHDQEIDVAFAGNHELRKRVHAAIGMLLLLKHLLQFFNRSE
jgi:hypothetical protein